MNFTEELWKKKIEENLSRLSYFKPLEKVKFFRIKKVMNKIFKTHYELYKKDPKAGTIKIVKVERPSIKNYIDKTHQN